MKVLFFDIDGTLIDNHKGIRTIPEEAKTELKRIRARGNKLLLATGRPRVMIHEEILGADFDGFVCFNGGYVEIEGKPVYQDRLDPELGRKSIELLKRMNCEYMLETGSHIYLHPEFQELYGFFEKLNYQSMFTFDFDEEEVLQRLMKIECNISKEKKKAIDDFLNSDYGFSINYDTHGTDFAFEFYSPTISKALGIRKVLDYYGISKEDAYAFGDGRNDLPMFEECGTKVCMGNGAEEVKQKADIVCGAIEANGMAEVLQQLFGGKQG